MEYSTTPTAKTVSETGSRGRKSIPYPRATNPPESTSAPTTDSPYPPVTSRALSLPATGRNRAKTPASPTCATPATRLTAATSAEAWPTSLAS